MIDHFKTALRYTNRQIREKLPLTFQQQAAHQIINKIKQVEQYRYAKHIALYYAVKGEVNLDPLWRSAPMQGKFCYFPALNAQKTLSFLSATPATPFIKSRLGIPEPDSSSSTEISIEEIDVVFMPLVAFDKNCTRLGMGAGYYDRTFAKLNHPLLIGVAYEFQQQPFLLAEEWDIPLTAVITEKKIYWK